MSAKDRLLSLKYFSKSELDDDIVCISLDSDISLQEWDTLTDALTELKKESPGNIKFLTDASQVRISSFDSSKRVKVAESFKLYKEKVVRHAIYGITEPFLASAVNVLILLSGRNNLKVFKTKEEAIPWLLKNS